MSKATCLILRSFALSVSDNSFGVLFKYSVMMSSKVLVAANSFFSRECLASVSLGAKIALTHDIWFGVRYKKRVAPDSHRELLNSNLKLNL